MGSLATRPVSDQQQQRQRSPEAAEELRVEFDKLLVDMEFRCKRSAIMNYHEAERYDYWDTQTQRKKNGTLKKRIMWSDQIIAGHLVPYTAQRTCTKACAYGQKREKKTSSTQENKSGQKKRFLIQPSRKVGCAAKLVVRRVAYYEEYKIPIFGTRPVPRGQKETAMTSLLNAMNADSQLEPGFAALLELPLASAHRNHTVTLESGFAKRIHPAVRDKIYHFVQNGVTRANVIRRLLQTFVTTELCADCETQPMLSDRAYFPKRKTIQFHIHQALKKSSYSGWDQDSLAQSLPGWREADKGGFFILRKCGETEVLHDKEPIPPRSLTKTSARKERPLPHDEDSSDSDSEDEETEEKAATFLFIHQSPLQRELLSKYGGMVFLDSTHSTSKFALPLFLLVVKTNVNFVPVAEIVTENESTAAIQEGLDFIKSWNPNWKPDHVMIDYSNEEYMAVRSLFPEAAIYLCSFHREQAWIRWAKQGRNGLSPAQQTTFLDLMRKIASTQTKEGFNQAVGNLTTHLLYTENPRVKHYVDKFWLSIPERWCPPFMGPRGFHTSSTNNGVEALNGSLKKNYLSISGDGSVSRMIQVLIFDFVRSVLDQYLSSNYESSQEFKAYNSSVPPFMRNRPRGVVLKLLDSYRSAVYCTAADVEQLGPASFRVASEDRKRKYEVLLGGKDGMPSCSCPAFSRSFLPCKHFMALFRLNFATWDSLPQEYRESPYLTLDDARLRMTTAMTGACENERIECSLEEDPVSCTDNMAEDSFVQKLSWSSAPVRLRDKLHRLHELSFLRPEPDIVLDICQSLDKLIVQLERAVPREEQLPLHNGETVKMTRELPLRRKHKRRQTSRARSTPEQGPGATEPQARVRKLRAPRSASASTQDPTSEEGPAASDTQRARKSRASSSTPPASSQDSTTEEIPAASEPREGVGKLSASLSTSASTQDPTPEQNSPATTPQERVPRHGVSSSTSTTTEDSAPEHLGPDASELQAQVGKLHASSSASANAQDPTLGQGHAASEPRKQVRKHRGSSSISVNTQDPPPEQGPGVSGTQGRVRKPRASRSTSASTQDPNPEHGSVVSKPRETAQILSASGTASASTQGSHQEQKKMVQWCWSQELDAEDFLVKELTGNAAKTTIEVNKAYYYLLGQKVANRDLECVRHPGWLTDIVVNAFLADFRMHQNRGDEDHIFVIPSYTTALWLEGRFDVCLYLKVKMTAFKWVLAPVCVGAHWVLIAVDMPARKFHVLDSLQSRQRVENLFKLWLTFCSVRARALKQPSLVFTCGNLQSSRQTDGSSCGPFVLMNAVALVKCIDPQTLSTQNSIAFRSYILRVLMTMAATDPAPLQCDVPGCQAVKRSKSYNCAVCVRWIHAKCGGIAKRQRHEDFVCFICNAQYGLH